MNEDEKLGSEEAGKIAARGFFSPSHLLNFQIFLIQEQEEQCSYSETF